VEWPHVTKTGNFLLAYSLLTYLFGTFIWTKWCIDKCPHLAISLKPTQFISYNIQVLHCLICLGFSDFTFSNAILLQRWRCNLECGDFWRQVLGDIPGGGEGFVGGGGGGLGGSQLGPGFKLLLQSLHLQPRGPLFQQHHLIPAAPQPPGNSCLGTPRQ